MKYMQMNFLTTMQKNKFGGFKIRDNRLKDINIYYFFKT